MDLEGKIQIYSPTLFHFCNGLKQIWKTMKYRLTVFGPSGQVAMKLVDLGFKLDTLNFIQKVVGKNVLVNLPEIVI